MRNELISQENPQQDRQLREELPGSWYNYEPSETTLDRQEFDHWLANLEVSENRPERQHRV